MINLSQATLQRPQTVLSPKNIAPKENMSLKTPKMESDHVSFSGYQYREYMFSRRNPEIIANELKTPKSVGNDAAKEMVRELKDSIKSEKKVLDVLNLLTTNLVNTNGADKDSLTGMKKFAHVLVQDQEALESLTFRYRNAITGPELLPLKVIAQEMASQNLEYPKVKRVLENLYSDESYNALLHNLNADQQYAYSEDTGAKANINDLQMKLIGFSSLDQAKEFMQMEPVALRKVFISIADGDAAEENLVQHQYEDVDRLGLLAEAVNQNFGMFNRISEGQCWAISEGMSELSPEQFEHFLDKTTNKDVLKFIVNDNDNSINFRKMLLNKVQPLVEAVETVGTGKIPNELKPHIKDVGFYANLLDDRAPDYRKEHVYQAVYKTRGSIFSALLKEISSKKMQPPKAH